MVFRPLMRYGALYLVLELAVVVLLVWALGFGWALLALAGIYLGGLLLAGSAVRGQIARLRRPGVDPRAAATDGALVGAGTALALAPGVVSTVAGALMLAGPTRSAMRPLAVAILTRGIVRRGFTGRVGFHDGKIVDGMTYGEVIDADVIDVTDGEVPGGDTPGGLPAVR
jgi:UPF0716 protein FxsA